VNPPEATTEMLRLSALLDDALAYLKKMGDEAAHAEDAYRMAKAVAYMRSDGPVAEREAQADIATSEERVRKLIADGRAKAALEAVRSRRTGR
jgi:hypothetical protein